jgi:S1-C subfamily serine protease
MSFLLGRTARWCQLRRNIFQEVSCPSLADGYNNKQRGGGSSTWLYWVALGGITCTYMYHSDNDTTLTNSIRSHSALTSFLPSVLHVKCAEKRSQRFNFLAESVEKVLPSIVYIEVQQLVPTLLGERIGVSNGSGFIVDERGYVMTNAHVVGHSKSVNVKLQNGRLITGSVAVIDEMTDLALVKLDLKKGETLPALTFGSSEDLRPGEWVVAIGSPLSLSNTITSGIISNAHRPSSDMGLQYHRPDMEYIQTDAAITHGNSGGPLVNLDGEVIGINTLTAAPGISFAIPSSFAKQFLDVAQRTAQKPRAKKFGIGISMLSITPEIRHHIQYRTSYAIKNGVLLAEVSPGTPADRSGLKKGDIIVKMDSKDVYKSSDIYNAVQIGKMIEFEVIRGNEKKLICVTPKSIS